jgi:hypothetical protein
MEQKTKSKKEQVLDILRKDVIEFGKVVSPVSFYLPTPDIHREITKLFLDESIKKLNIIAPRGIAKTSLVTFYILHHLFFGDEGKKMIVIVSKTQTHAKSILSTIKNVIEFSAGFRRLFGYHGSQNAKTWREDKIVLANGNSIVARGTGQPIRGVGERLQRPTLIVIDDPEDENNTKTIEAMDHNVTWVLAAAGLALDTLRGRVIAIGTPLHEKCIVMTLSEMEGWTTIHYGNSLENNIILWPESKSREALEMEKRDFESIGKLRLYYQEYECNLIPGGDAIFVRDDIQFYDPETTVEFITDEPYLKFPNGIVIPVSIYMGIDPASSVAQTAAYSTIVPVAVTTDLRVYVLDYFRKRVKPSEHADNIEAFYLRLRPRRTLVEVIGYQESLRDTLRNRIFIPGLEQKETPHDSKSDRYIEMLEPIVKSHKLYIKGTYENKKYRGPMEALFDEMVLFPKCKTKDLLDGLYYACKRVRPPTHSIVPVKESLPEYQQVIVEYYQTKEENLELPTYFDENFS